jgi:hypothetical protein
MGDLFYLSHDDYSHLSSFPPRGLGGIIRLSSQLRSCALRVVLTRFQRDGGEFRVGIRYGRCGRREDQFECERQLDDLVPARCGEQNAEAGDRFISDLLKLVELPSSAAARIRVDRPR